ncbi:MAG: DUF262 domain-containing protein [Nostoc sp.]|uniref:DUF262 domain-containing protein n=1 Tax=Nostoc sp. TaxID=1180 RepID=UPI002FF854AF
MPVGQNFLTQLKKVRVVKKTITRTVRDLITDFQSTKIVIPPYQRTFVWDSAKQYRFIESIFMDIPIPPLFLLEKFSNETGETIFEIIDGVQRVTTLGNFLNGTLKLSGLESLPDLNQATFPSLPPSISSLFWERQINIIIIESDTQPEIQFEVFGRLNQGSVSLNAQELRNCMFHGEFNDFLFECSRIPIYREILEPFAKFHQIKEGKPDKNRMLDVELILRFFSLYELYKPEINQYPEARSETLNAYMRARIDNSIDDDLPSKRKNQEELESLLKKVLLMVQMTFNGKQFRNFSVKKGKADFSLSQNQAVFDIQMLGFADYSIADIENKTKLIYNAFLDLCSYDRNFIDAVSRSTSSKLNERIGIWKNKLNLIMENPQPYLEKIEQKQQHFNSNPLCSSSGKIIETIDEADFVDSQLYHRFYSPSSEMISSTSIISTRSSPNTDVKFILNGSEYDLGNVNDAIEFIIKFLTKTIKDDDYEISRLAELKFIGTVDQLSSRVNKSPKKFRPLHLSNKDSEDLYIDISGCRSENLKNLECMASLFSFMSDFKLIE